MDTTDIAHVSAVAGALGVALALLPRGNMAPLAGIALLGSGTIGLGWSLSEDDIRLLLGEPSGLALLGAGVLLAILLAAIFVRYAAVVPVALVAVAPFRIPVAIGAEDAFLLVPLYAVLTAAVLALAWRVARGERTPAIPFLVALPLAALAAYASLSLLWTADLRAGSIALAFFVFPFTAGTTAVARSPMAGWLPRALGATFVSLACVFALIGLWQAQTRTLFFAPDLEVANAYTSYFRVTSLFKDPSLYGRWLVIAIAVTLIGLWLGRIRAALGVGVIAFLFIGLFFSYSQSSFVALFAVTFALALALGDRRLRVALTATTVVAFVAAGAVAAATVMDADGRDATSGRSKLARITLEAWETAPVVGVGIGGQPKVSHEQAHTISVRRSASHATPLTILAELGVFGLALYVALLAAAGLALARATGIERSLGLGLSATFLVLVVHSLLYAGFFEDPLTWGVLGIAAGILVTRGATAPTPAEEPE